MWLVKKLLQACSSVSEHMLKNAKSSLVLEVLSEGKIVACSRFKSFGLILWCLFFNILDTLEKEV